VVRAAVTMWPLNQICAWATFNPRTEAGLRLPTNERKGRVKVIQHRHALQSALTGGTNSFLTSHFFYPYALTCLFSLALSVQHAV